MKVSTNISPPPRRSTPRRVGVGGGVAARTESGEAISFQKVGQAAAPLKHRGPEAGALSGMAQN